jgi:hypothetical protein
MADSDPTLADLSPALQTVRQAIIAFVDRGAIPVHDIPSLCMHVARLDREGKPPGPDWMRQLAEFLPGAFMLAAEGMKGSVADVRAGLERRAFSAEQLLQAIGDGMMGRVNGGDVPTLTSFAITEPGSATAALPPFRRTPWCEPDPIEMIVPKSAHLSMSTDGGLTWTEVKQVSDLWHEALTVWRSKVLSVSLTPDNSGGEVAP